MPQIESRAKTVRSSAKSTKHNKQFRSKTATAVRNLELAVENDNFKEAEKLFQKANSLLDKSLARKIHHRNYVQRKKSMISKLYNTLKQTQ